MTDLTFKIQIVATSPMNLCLEFPNIFASVILYVITQGANQRKTNLEKLIGH